MDKRGATEPQPRQPRGAPWTEAELKACVVAYRSILSLEEQGEPANKSDVRRRTVAAELINRGEGAYEWRMQNISAVLDEMGLPWIRGYKPARHVHSAREPLARMIAEAWNLERS